MTEYSVYIQGGRTGNSWHLSVTEDKSRCVILDVTLTPEEAWKVQTGGGVHVNAFVAGDLDRLGKKMLNWNRSIPHEVGGYGEISPEARQWAIDAEDKPFDVVSLYRSNTGVIATYHRWVDDE